MRIHTLTLHSANISYLQPESTPSEIFKVSYHHLKLENQTYLSEFKRISSDKLKVGDMVLLEKNLILPCDIILLIGKHKLMGYLVFIYV